MHKSRLGGLIIDCQVEDLAAAKSFWTSALGYGVKDTTHPDDAGYVVFDTKPDEPHIELQKVTHPSRVHIDIETNDVEAEVSRLEGLGARKIEKVQSWWIMEAPTGHRFCVIEAARSDFDENANNW